MTPVGLAAWAHRWSVPPEAFVELRLMLGAECPPPPPPTPAQASEAYSQSQVRLEAPHKGVRLWRNNVGVLEDKRGVPVRYGLANDSRQLNERLKSSDLIGWRRLTITPAMVGAVVAQFVSRECKRPGWTYTGDDREVGQERWINLVQADGGDAAFTTGPGSL